MPRRNKPAILLIFLVMTVSLALASTQQASAQEEEVSYSSVVVQNRKHLGTHEFSASLGVLALDAFTKGVTVGGSYTLHFTEHLAWEVAQFAYSLHVDTELKEELQAFDLRPTPFEVIDFYAMSNFVLKPVYWKGSVFNSGLIYGEWFFTLGGGYGWFTRSSRPGVDVGTGFRVYGTELLSFRLDARYLFFFNNDILTSFEVKDDLWVALSTSLAF